jgi:hypothetical protein
MPSVQGAKRLRTRTSCRRASWMAALTHAERASLDTKSGCMHTKPVAIRTNPVVTCSKPHFVDTKPAAMITEPVSQRTMPACGFRDVALPTACPSFASWSSPHSRLFPPIPGISNWLILALHSGGHSVSQRIPPAPGIKIVALYVILLGESGVTARSNDPAQV